MSDLVPLPRRVVATPDDVMAPFAACATSSFDGVQGWEDTDCQDLSPDGLHKCWDSAGYAHEPEHWCLCRKAWPIKGADEPTTTFRPPATVTFRTVGNYERMTREEHREAGT